MIATPADALWNQRKRIASLSDRLKNLMKAVAHPGDLRPNQWVQLTAVTLDFRPQLIIELGRGYGNSTCCFLEAANQLGGPSACKLLSICNSDSWFKQTAPRLKEVVPEQWFDPAEIRECDILEYDFAPIVQQADRCLVFWDAHGFEVAQYVLGGLLPLLSDRQHRVLMHDMTDTRYNVAPREYHELGLWKGMNAGDTGICLGHIQSRVAQAISIVDFTTRNGIPLHSAEESLYGQLAHDPAKMTELTQLLGDELFGLSAHWFWFTLDEASESLTFPRFERRPMVKLNSAEPKPNDIWDKLSAHMTT